MNSTIGIGVLGAGTVGGTLVARLVDDHAAIATKTGLDLRVKRVAVRDLDKPRDFTVTNGVLTDDRMSVIDDPDIDLVAEIPEGLPSFGLPTGIDASTWGTLLLGGASWPW